MNTIEVLSGLNEAIAAFHRLPVVESELKLVTEDRDFAKLQIDEANEMIAKLKFQIETMKIDNAADKVKITNLENQITELNNRNADLDDTANELINQVRNLTIDVDAATQRIRILAADKESLSNQLTSAKSFGSKLAEKLQDISQLLTATPDTEATNIAPFPVSNAMGMPVSAIDTDNAAPASDAVMYVDKSAGEDMVKIIDVAADVPATETDDSVAAGCNVYRYW